MKSKTADEIESWFLAALEQTPLPAMPLLAALAALQKQGAGQRLEGCAALLQDALVERGDAQELIRLFDLLARWRGADSGFRQKIRGAMARVMKDRERASYLKSAGFDQELPAAECLRRLKLLVALAPGALCLDKTWGFGVVRAMDAFYQKVAIDFEKKPGHSMSFAYAAEALEVLDNDHLLARRHRDPQALQALVAADPAEIVRIAVRSCGPISAVRVRDVLVPAVVSEAAWKEFWERARKVLKSDPLVDLPSKRSDPIRLLERAKDYGDAWFADFAQERDMQRILARIDELEREMAAETWSGAQRATVGDRLGFAIHGARGMRPDLHVRAILVARRLGFAGGLGLDEAAARYFDPARLVEASLELPGRWMRPLMRYLVELDPARASALLLDCLPSLPLGPLAEAVGVLQEAGREADFTARVRSLLPSRKAGVVLVCWIVRNLDGWRAKLGLSVADVLGLAVEALEEPVAGERLRAANQIREMIVQREWLGPLLSALSELEGRAFVGKVKGSRAWDEGGRRDVLGAIVKLQPGMQAVIAGQSDEKPDAPRAAARLTSWRSYAARQEQLRKLVQEDIPKNSRDIAQARSYGDLRENFEYQAAKDQQRLLLQRHSELDADLKAVQPTAFEGFRTDRVGVGTGVLVARADGRRVTFYVLGDWDRDEALGIISSQSRLAVLMSGRAAGDEVILPMEEKEEPCRIEAVTALPDAVRQWIGTPGSH